MFASLKDLFVNYGAIEVLKGVSLELAEGEIALLLGANGAGKSTILKALSGLIPVYSGEMWFLDKRIDGLSPTNIVRSGIVHVPEGRKLFPYLSVFNNLKLGASARKDKVGIKRDLDKTFEQFPILWEKRNQRAGTLSAGQQETLAIARALMAKPKLLLVDEPSQGLAPAVISTVAKIITGINRDGVTILMVEHNLRLGLSISHKVYVLENGKIVFQAKSADLSGVEYAKRIYLGGTWQEA